MTAAVAQTTPITTIINPGFEIGVPGSAVSSGWTQSAGPMFIATAGSPGLLAIDPTAAFEGTQFLTGNRQVGNYATSEVMRVFQDVDLSPYASQINQGGRGLELSFAYNDSDGADNGIVSFSFRDSGNLPIGNSYMFDTNSAPTGAGSWLTSKLAGEVPTGAATLRISLEANFTGGTIRNISYDNIAAGLGALPVDPPASDRVHGNLIQFNNDGAWSWYMDERSIADPTNGHLLIGSVTTTSATTGRTPGSVDVVDYDPTTGTRRRTTLANIQSDDHNAAGLMILPNGKYLAMYSNHGNTGLGDYLTRYRVSNAPHDSSSWTTEQTFNWQTVTGWNTPPQANNRVSYHNLFYLADDDGGQGRTYNFSRGTHQSANSLLFDQSDNSLEWGGQLTQSATGGYSTGYLKYASNGTDRIYFISTETHPRNYNNNMWAGYVSDGKSYDMLGNLIDANIFDNEDTAGVGAVPDISSFTSVQMADPLGAGYNRLWTVDLSLDAGQNPVAMYISRYDTDGSNPGNDQNADHRIHYARWDGAQWHSYEIARMGSHIEGYVSEEDYTGNGALVPGDSNTVYISTQYDPRDASGQTTTTWREIYKGVTSNGGADWNWSAITENSTVNNLRPVVPDSYGGDRAVIWFRGTYTSAQNINAAVVGIIERDDEQIGPVQYVDANSSNTMYATGAALQTSTPSGSGGPTDNLWHLRTGFGNGGNVLTSNESGSENAPMLKTTLTGLDDGSYDIFAFFWSDNDEDWRLSAGLNQGNLTQFRHHGAQHAEAEQFEAIDVVSANSADLLLYRAYLGRTNVVAGSPIGVFIDDWSTGNNTLRTWYDGLGYALVSEVIQGLLGDYNGDFVVDAADYTVWRNNLGALNESVIHNNGDGLNGVDLADYALWKAHFGTTALPPGRGAGGNAAVPEPSTTALLLLAAATAMCAANRRDTRVNRFAIHP